MNGHGARESRHEGPDVASDVASGQGTPLFDYFDAPLLAVGIASVGFSRAQVPDAPPSSVTFVPAELAPFAVRCEFRRVEDANGTEREALVGAPALVETASASRQHAEITKDLEYVLETHRWHYQRIAERLLDADVKGAVERREAMLRAERRKASSARREWTALERVDLLREYEERRGEKGLMSRLADERGIQVSGISRQLPIALAERAERASTTA